MHGVELACRADITIVAEPIFHGTEVFVLCFNALSTMLLIIYALERSYGRLLICIDTLSFLSRLAGKILMLFLTLVVVASVIPSTSLHLAVEGQTGVLIATNKSIVHGMIGGALALQAG